MATSRSGLYVNTFVFSIIAALVCLILFLALWFGSSGLDEYAYMIITVEVGLLLVIIQAIARIIAYELRLKKEQSYAMDSALRVQSCPDYWTLTENGPVRECNATYTTPDGRTNYVMHDDTNKVVLSDLDKKSVKVVCTDVSARKAPWTDMRTACLTYNALM